ASDMPLGLAFNLPALAAGTSIEVRSSVTLPSSLPFGNGYVGIWVDLNSAITESTEIDNSGSRLVGLLAGADALEPNNLDTNAVPLTYINGIYSASGLTISP